MEKSDSPKVYGVLGFPVKHSFSPAMHNAAFHKLSLPAEYRKFEKGPEELTEFLRTLANQNIFGINVTIPYKEKVVPFLEWSAPEVRFTGACNTIIVKRDGGLEGWNTDGIGFNRHLKSELGFDIKGKKTVVLGAGGASKAICDQLGRFGARSLVLYDVDSAKANALADKLNAEFPDMRTRQAASVERLDIKNADLLVNATPVGMKPENPCIVEQTELHSRLFVYDVIYNPAETELLKRSRSSGARISNGLGMLLYQGARSFELWTQMPAPVEVMKAALEEEIKKL